MLNGRYLLVAASPSEILFIIGGQSWEADWALSLQLPIYHIIPNGIATNYKYICTLKSPKTLGTIP